jgi:hypothetical protein
LLICTQSPSRLTLINAYACIRVDLPDGTYTLTQEGDGTVDGELNQECAARPGSNSRRAQGLCWCRVWGRQAPVSSNPFCKLKSCLLLFSIYALLCAFKFQELLWNLDAWSLGPLCSLTSMLGKLVPCSKVTVEVE